MGALLLLAGAVSSHAQPAGHVGLRQLTVEAPARGATIEVMLWYPAGAGGTPERFGASKVFKGVAALRDAPIAEGRFPLIVLAHGGLRANPAASGWIASALAGRRYIVAVAQAPHLGPGDARRAIREVWLRPPDLSAALTAVQDDDAFADHLEPGQVGAVGFFLGGTSVLALAGARLDAASYGRSCDHPAPGPDCRWFAGSGVDLHRTDLAPAAAAHRDPRIKVVVAVDPELTGSMARASLRAIGIHVAIINLGMAQTLRPRLDASAAAAQIPDGRYETLPDATTFSAFDQCTPQGAAILAADGDDELLCRDGGFRPREQIHAQLVSMIAGELAQGLRAPP